MSVPGFSTRYELPQYGSRRRLLSPSGMYDEYGEVVVESDGGYYYSPQGTSTEAEVGLMLFQSAKVQLKGQFSPKTFCSFILGPISLSTFGVFCQLKKCRKKIEIGSQYIHK